MLTAEVHRWLRFPHLSLEIESDNSNLILLLFWFCLHNYRFLLLLLSASEVSQPWIDWKSASLLRLSQ